MNSKDKSEVLEFYNRHCTGEKKELSEKELLCMSKTLMYESFKLNKALKDLAKEIKTHMLKFFT